MTSRFSRKRWRLLPGCFAALITLALCYLGVLTQLENASYRWSFQMLGARSWDDRIVLVTIDDDTLGELGQYPLSRDVYTQLLEKLSASRPSVIGFNILFIEPSPADAELAAAIAKMGNVVIAIGSDGQGNLLTPTEPLYSAAIASGHILKQIESDGLVHTIDPWSGNVAAFGITLAEVYAFTRLPTELPPLDHPLQINWPGPKADVPQYSLADVIAGRVSPTAFNDKVVLVGMTATGVDALPTPFDNNPPASGTLLQAAVIDNTLQQRYLRSIRVPGFWVLLIVTMPGASYFLIGQPLRKQLLLTIISMVGCLGVSSLLFSQNYWLPITSPLILFGLTGIGGMVAQQLRANLALQHLLDDLWHHYRHDTNLAIKLSAPSPSIPEDLGDEVHRLALLANSLGWAQAAQAAISQTIPIAMLAVDDRDQIWFCNPLATEQLGIRLGTSLTTYLVPKWLDEKTWHKTLCQVWRGDTIAPIECRQATAWFELRFERLNNLAQANALLKDGRRGFLMLVEDITHRKSTEVKLRLLNEGLEDEVRQRAEELESTNLNLLQEIVERRQVQEKLAYQALHDELTGLPNRSALKTWLTELVEQFQNNKEKDFAVLFIDCDRFKLINDSFGHLMGDELLKAISNRLRHCIARTDRVVRFGGDEFVVLLTNIKDSQSVITVARRIRQQLQKPFSIHKKQLYTGCSIGIVLSQPVYTQAEDMLRDADIAMYRAKRSGMGYTFFEPEMHLAVRSSLQLETDLRQAVKRQEQLLVYYQPIFAIETRQIVGFEALIRWQHPHLGLIGPDKFIPIAEETGLIVQIGQHVLREACNQLRIWQRKGCLPVNTFMSVNLSVQQFNEPNLLDRIDEILQDTQLDSRYLKLEITESAIMANSDLAVRTFHHLRERGIRLGIDDFGTGYSSLSYLHCFPIDVLKVDRSFIQRMVQGHKYLSLVQAIRTLAHHFDITMIAEGIETEIQIEQLMKMDCILGQGFVFCPPLDHQTLETRYLGVLN